MKQNYSITHPELLTLTDGNQTWNGADQEWYQENWRRRSGCGTTAAAHLLSYLAKVKPNWKVLYPHHSREKSDFLSFMNELWNYVTPGSMGVNSVNKLTCGISNYAKEKNVTLSFHKLNIPQLKTARPTIEQCTTFFRTAMENNSPVAFLNLSAGNIKGLDSWHWITIIAIQEQSDGSILCTALDGSGHKLIVDFYQWLQTSRLGGGLVYIS